jgi:hypothetical protein
MYNELLEKGTRPLKPQSSRSNTPAVIRGLLVLATVTMVPATAFAGLKVYEKDDMTLELGLRMQPRWEYDRVLAPAAAPSGSVTS